MGQTELDTIDLIPELFQEVLLSKAASKTEMSNHEQLFTYYV